MRGVHSCSAHLGRSNIPVVTVLAYFFVPKSVLADRWRNIAIALNDPLVALSVFFLIFESAKIGRRSRPPHSCGQRPTLDVRASQREPSTRMKAPKAKINIRQNGEKNSLFRSTVPPTFEFIAAKTDAEGQ